MVHQWLDIFPHEVIFCVLCRNSESHYHLQRAVKLDRDMPWASGGGWPRSWLRLQFLNKTFNVCSASGECHQYGNRQEVLQLKCLFKVTSRDTEASSSLPACELPLTRLRGCSECLCWVTFLCNSIILSFFWSITPFTTKAVKGNEHPVVPLCCIHVDDKPSGSSKPRKVTWVYLELVRDVFSLPHLQQEASKNPNNGISSFRTPNVPPLEDAKGLSQSFEILKWTFMKNMNFFFCECANEVVLPSLL